MASFRAAIGWAAIGLAALVGSTISASALDYPTRSVRFVVGYPAGGATDTLARFLAEQMRPLLGQSIIIENVRRCRSASARV